MLTFGYYFKKGGENSRHIHGQLLLARHNILKNAIRTKVEGTTLKQFEQDLNTLFYNKKNPQEYQAITQQINKNVVESYYKETDKILNNFDITNRQYSVTSLEAFGPEFNAKIKDIQDKLGDSRTNMTFAVARRYINIVYDALDRASKKMNNNNIIGANKDIQEAKNNIDQLSISIEKIFKEAGYKDILNDYSLIMSKTTGVDDKKDWLKKFRKLEAMVIALTTHNGKSVLSTQEYGLPLELVFTEFKNAIGKTEDATLQRLSEYAGVHVGKTPVGRGGQTLSMDIESRYLGDTSYRGVWDNKNNTWKRNKRTGKIITEKYYYINTNPLIEIKYTEEQDEDDTQGKADVILKYQDEDLRMSLKNWDYNVSTKNNFGKTSLLAGLNRSLNNKLLLEGYTMTLQYPHVGYDEAGSRLNGAHNLAKMSLVADILMGYSQKTGYANCLVIHQRGRGFKVIDIVKVLQNLNKNLNQINEHIDGFDDDKIPVYLDGYNENLLQDTAINVRDLILKSNRVGLNTKNYYGIMYNYFKGQQIVLKAKAQLFNK